MKALIVDDEKLIRNIIKEYLVKENFEIIEAETGIEAIEQVKTNDIDIIILDIMMPELDGFSAYKEIKKISNIPTIILSARTEEYDKLTGFDLGIDDYLTKPFSPKELVARVKAILNRSNKKEDIFKYKTLKLDKIAHALYIDDKEIEITPKEFDLLVYLIENENVALSRGQLLNKVWGYSYYGDDRTVDTHIKMLRNNLKEYRNLIKTIRGVGYKFEKKQI